MVGVEPTRQSPVLKHFECSLLRPLEYICLFNFVARNFPQGVISSRSRYDLFDSPPYISTVFRALRKCKKNTQEQYEILKFDPAKTLINQGFSAEKTARANAHFESISLRPLRYVCLFSFYRTAPHSVWKNARFRCKITMKSWVRDTR